MLNQNAISLIKKHEGLRLRAYQCTASMWTVGFGHVGDDYFPVTKETIITEEKANELLIHDLAEAEDTVKRQYSDWELLNENQYGAIVSFVFNTGSLKYYDKKKKAFLERTILKFLRKHDWVNVANSFLIYTKDKKGNVLKGLRNRRIEEKALFEKPISQ